MYHWTREPINRATGLPSTWQDLHERLSASPLLHADFVNTCLSFLGSGEEALFTCRADGETICMVVLQPLGSGRWATFQPSQAPIGFWLQSPGHDIAELLGSLHSALPLTVALVSITQQDPDLVPRPADRGRVATVDYIDTARIVVSGDWASYWAGRGSNLRHNLKRSKAKLASSGRKLQVESITDGRLMRKAVETYGSIESASWKASEGTAVSAENVQGQFYAALLERFSDRGRAICYQLLIDGEVAATDLCIAGYDELIILKTTFDERFKEYSPAFLMRETAFMTIFDRHSYTRIEFYGRVMDWHLRWTDQVRRMYHVNHFRLAILKRLAARSAQATTDA